MRPPGGPPEYSVDSFYEHSLNEYFTNTATGGRQLFAYDLLLIGVATAAPEAGPRLTMSWVDRCPTTESSDV